MFEGRNVHFSTDNKPLCSFSGKLCKLRRLNGYAFCVRHILEDPTAPFRQCAFVVKSSGLKCTSAIPQTQDRMYCNAHMQVMGIIPKKERKKKVEPLFMPDTDGNGIHKLEKYSPAALINGYSEDMKTPNKSFSASKMFPELAGKLSLDNHSVTFDNSTKTAAANLLAASQNSLNESIESVIDDNNKQLKSPSRQTGSTPKRQRKPTRKSLSILRKKRLGLLTDEEARTKFTASGCQAYSHYIKFRTYETDLLTALVDSSDDEGGCLTTLLPVTSRISHVNLRGKDLKSEPLSVKHSDGDKFITTVTMTNSNPLNDLNIKTESADADDVSNSVTTRIDVKPDYPSVFDLGLTSLKQTCSSLSKSERCNKDVINFSKLYLRQLLKALRENQTNASKLVKQIHHPSHEHHTAATGVHKPTQYQVPTQQQSQQPQQQIVMPPSANKKTKCMHTSENTEQKCSNWALPYANRCITHISTNVEQRLFSHCMYKSEDESQQEMCPNMVIDTGHGKPLCNQHALQLAVDKVEADAALLSEAHLKKTKKKSKSFALLKSYKKKKRKGLGTFKSDTSYQSSTDISASDTGKLEDVDTSDATIKFRDDKSAEESHSQVTPEDSDDIDDDTLNRSLELPLDHADSKLLLDKDIEDVLNGGNFDLFSGKHTDDDIGLTEAEAELILSGAGEAMMEDFSDELPDDITDTILHVESEQQAHQAALQSQQHQQQQIHPPMSVQHSMQQSPHIMSNSYDISTSMSHSYSESDFNSSGLSSPYAIPPPPQYPGQSKMLAPVSHLTASQHTNHMNYLHEQQQVNYQHPIHHKMAPHPVTAVSGHMIINGSYGHVQASSAPLPPSSTLLDAGHLSSSMNRVPSLPPLSIAMHQWQPSAASDTHYQNGYHNLNEHSMYLQNRLPSSPQYGGDQSVLYHSSPYNPNYSRTHGNHHLSTVPQRLNMPLQ